jgi:hypothetical protein
MAKETPLKIVRLDVENVKRIVAVSITPTGAMVEIAGKNAAGKSSILDSIWFALGGAGALQKAPIRKGQDKASIRLDLGDYIVLRKFARISGDEFTTSLTVENAEGGKLTKGQTLVESFLGDLTLDPLEFTRMKPRDQFDTLKGYVEGVDIEAIDAANRTDFDKRTDVNRRAKGKTAEADALPIPEATPAGKVDEAELVDEIAAVGTHNGEIAERKLRRENAAEAIETTRKAAAKARADAVRLRNEADQADGDAANLESQAETLDARLKAAPPLPESKDASEVRTRLDVAKKTNAAVALAERRKTLREEADKLDKESEAITARMEARAKQKQDAIATAKLPVEGITFADGAILLGGVPFDQASDAEQLRASVAIAMAGEPRLRVLRIREGSLLDEDGLKLVAEMAQARDWQVWIERVTSGGKGGFVIEDGQVRSTPEPAQPVLV